MLLHTFVSFILLELKPMLFELELDPCQSTEYLVCVSVCFFFSFFELEIQYNFHFKFQNRLITLSP